MTLWHMLTAAVLLASTAGCAVGIRGAAEAPPSLAGQLLGRVRAEDGIVWSATRPLVWSDFRATAPSRGAEGARTAYSLLHGLRCTGDQFEFRALTVFLPDRSWVKAEVRANPGESQWTLRHEQTHFNLSEVYTRRMRRHFADLVEPCRQSEEALQASAERVVEQESAAQRRYDAETRHGLDDTAQRQWDREVARLLTSLDAYARASTLTE